MSNANWENMERRKCFRCKLDRMFVLEPAKQVENKRGLRWIQIGRCRDCGSRQSRLIRAPA